MPRGCPVYPGVAARRARVIVARDAKAASMVALTAVGAGAVVVDDLAAVVGLVAMARWVAAARRAVAAKALADT